MTSGWRLHLHGAPRLEQGAGGRALALSARDAAWLALVACLPAAPRALVVQQVWPLTDLRGAQNNLHQRLFRLRRATGVRLIEASETLRLADDLSVVPAPSATALEADVAAWDAEPLAGVELPEAEEFGRWLERLRRSWAERRSEALAAIAARAEQQGELARALVYARHIVQHERLSEHAHRRLMRLHYLRGDSAAAVAAFERCEAVLREELGVRPNGETRALLATIERRQASPSAPLQPLPPQLFRPPAMVGRKAALARLAACERDGQVAVLVGEAGMGKTRLLQEHLAGRGDALHVQARPGDASVPYATLTRLIERLPPSETPIEVHRPERLAPGLLVRLTGLPLWRLIAIDDAHFADRATLEMLVALATAEPPSGLRWVFAHRPLSRRDAASALGALADSGAARRIELEPLTGDELEALLTSLALEVDDSATVAAQLARSSAGNPLFALETLRGAWANGALVQPLPKPVALSHLIEQRLARLSPAALALARVAAIASPDFSVALAQAVLGQPAMVLADPWHELERAQILRGEQFAHDLLEETLRLATPEVVARQAHREVARFLAGQNANPALLAAHWRQAGDAARAAEAYAQAAVQAEAACRPREQAELLDECAKAHDEAGDVQAATHARLRRIDALLQGHSTTEAIDAARELATRAADSPLAADAEAALAQALAWSARVDEAVAAARRALDPALRAGPQVQVVATSVLAQASALRGEFSGALALMLPWRTRIGEVNDAVVRRDFCGHLAALLLQCNRSGEALPVAEQHLALARETGHGGEQVAAHMNLSNLYGRRGEVSKAIAQGREADRVAREQDRPALLVWWNRSTLGHWLSASGCFDEALSLLEGAVAALAESPVQQQLAQGLLARLWLQLGQPARARHLVQAMSSAPPGRLLAGQLALRASLAESTGSDARDLWQAVLAQNDPDGQPALTARLTLCAGAADLEGLRAVQRSAEELEFYPIAAEAATRALALENGDGIALAQAAADAEARALQWRSPSFYLPEQLLRCADAFARSGQVLASRRCVDAAWRWLHEEALPHVPAPFVEGFLHRQPVNVALRRAVTVIRDGCRGAQAAG